MDEGIKTALEHGSADVSMLFIMFSGVVLILGACLWIVKVFKEQGTVHAQHIDSTLATLTDVRREDLQRAEERHAEDRRMFTDATRAFQDVTQEIRAQTTTTQRILDHVTGSTNVVAVHVPGESR